MKRLGTCNSYLVLLFFAILAVCPARADELLVSAAISLRPPFVEIGAAFERAHPGDRVTFNFGGSGELMQQIERGAPADLFASASVLEMSRLKQKHLLVDSSIRPFASNALVVIVPAGEKRISSFEELSHLGRVTIGNPETVPAGRYAAEALTDAGVYKRLVAGHKLVFSESARQVLNYVESGNVDGGIVYLTDARLSKKATICFSVPASFTERIVYPIAVVADSKHVKLGLSFIDFLNGKVASAILKSKGFIAITK